MQNAELILASGSSARSEMLKAAGVPFSVEVARVDELAIKASMSHEGLPPRDIADALAEAKAKRVSDRRPGMHVLSADQILVFDGQIFDKPETLKDAHSQLTKLRGETHKLISAAVMMKDGVVSFRHIEIAKLTMRSFSDEFLDAYLKEEGDTILTCVGSYRLEALGSQLFSHIAGDYFTVLGLPLLPCLAHLRDQGIIRP